MGAAESEILTVSRDGVSVEKSFEPDSFPVPAIAFEISSSRDGAATVRLVDVLPEEVDGTDVGFHPDYGDEFWSVEDGEIVFEREFDGGESFTTVYAVREGDLDTIERFLVEPELETVDPAEEVVGDSSQVVRDVLSGSADSVPGLGDDDGEDEDEEEIEPLNLQDPTGGSPAGGVAIGDPAADGDSEEEAVEAVDAGVSGPDIAAPDTEDGVAESLAAEIRAGEADEESLAVLRDALGTETGDGGSGGSGGGGTSSAVEARIQRLQTDVSDLRAYTDALEEFLDEEGRGREVLEEVRAEVDRLDERLAAAEDHRERVEAGVDDVESSVEDVAGSVDDVRGSVDVLEGSLADVRESVSGVEEDVQSVQGRVGSLKGTVDGLAGDLSELEAAAATDEDVAALEERIEGVEQEMAADLEQRLGDIEDQLDAMGEDIEQFAQFRQRVQSVFGGVGGDEE